MKMLKNGAFIALFFGLVLQNTQINTQNSLARLAASSVEHVSRNKWRYAAAAVIGIGLYYKNKQSSTDYVQHVPTVQASNLTSKDTAREKIRNHNIQVIIQDNHLIGLHCDSSCQVSQIEQFFEGSRPQHDHYPCFRCGTCNKEFLVKSLDVVSRLSNVNTGFPLNEVVAAQFAHNLDFPCSRASVIPLNCTESWIGKYLKGQGGILVERVSGCSLFQSQQSQQFQKYSKLYEIYKQYFREEIGQFGIFPYDWNSMKNICLAIPQVAGNAQTDDIRFDQNSFIDCMTLIVFLRYTDANNDNILFDEETGKFNLIDLDPIMFDLERMPGIQPCCYELNELQKSVFDRMLLKFKLLHDGREDLISILRQMKRISGRNFTEQENENHRQYIEGIMTDIDTMLAKSTGQ